MISVALGELNCPSLDYAYRMTWAEFILRLLSFNRQQEIDMFKIRALAWATHNVPKKGQTIDNWWRIGKRKAQVVSKEHKEEYLRQYKEYLKKKEHGRA